MKSLTLWTQWKIYNFSALKEIWISNLNRCKRVFTPEKKHPQRRRLFNYLQFELDGKLINAELCLQVRTLFVSGLPMDAKPRELYLLFRAYEVRVFVRVGVYIHIYVYTCTQRLHPEKKPPAAERAGHLKSSARRAHFFLPFQLEQRACDFFFIHEYFGARGFNWTRDTNVLIFLFFFFFFLSSIDVSLTMINLVWLNAGIFFYLFFFV